MYSTVDLNIKRIIKHIDENNGSSPLHLNSIKEFSIFLSIIGYHELNELILNMPLNIWNEIVLQRKSYTIVLTAYEFTY